MFYCLLCLIEGCVSCFILSLSDRGMCFHVLFSLCQMMDVFDV